MRCTVRLAFAGGVSRSTWCLAVYTVRSRLLRVVSQWSAGRVGACGRFSIGYVESSESALITKMEGVWDHLELGKTGTRVSGWDATV